MKKFGEYCNQYNLKQGQVVRILANDDHPNLKNKLAVAYPFKPECGKEFTSSTQLRVAFKPLKSWEHGIEGRDYFCINMHAVEPLRILCTEHPDFKEMFKDLQNNEESTSREFNIGDEVEVPVTMYYREESILSMDKFIYTAIPQKYRDGGSANLSNNKGVVVDFFEYDSKKCAIVKCIDRYRNPSNAGFLPKDLKLISSHKTNQNGQEPTTTTVYKVDRPVAKITTGKRSGNSITAGRRSSFTIESRPLRKQEVFV